MEIAKETNAAGLTDTALDSYSGRRKPELLHMKNVRHSYMLAVLLTTLR